MQVEIRDKRKIGGRQPPSDVHHFFGLEGIELLKQGDLDRNAAKREEHHHYHREITTTQDAHALSRSAVLKSAPNAPQELGVSPPPQWPRSRSQMSSGSERNNDSIHAAQYLRLLSLDDGNRTIYHDLLTPHRSYAFKGTAPFLSDRMASRAKGYPWLVMYAENTSSCQ
jgi:hypothetical protein